MNEAASVTRRIREVTGEAVTTRMLAETGELVVRVPGWSGATEADAAMAASLGRVADALEAEGYAVTALGGDERYAAEVRVAAKIV